jgi:hypothetical protein
MALTILYVGHRVSLGALNNAAFTKSNATGNPQLANNQTLIQYADTKGVLGGSVAAAVGSGLIGPAGAAGPSDAVVGLFINNAAGNPFENSPAAASGVGPYVSGMGVYDVDIFETQDIAGNPITLPQVGEKLYSSQNGLLTTERGLAGGVAPAGSTVIGIVLVAPSGSNMIMRFELRI